MKKLIPALCMLLVAATLLGTSTYAWFSMNTQVIAQGMNVKATTSKNLLISNEDGSSYAELADAKTSSMDDMVPVSTSDLTSWYYCKDATGVDYATGVAGTATVFDTAAVADPYVYKNTFKVKTSNPNDEFVGFYVSNITVTHKDGTAGLEMSKSLRVGVKVGSKVLIFAPNGGQTSYNAITGTTNASTTAVTAYNTYTYTAATTLGEVTNTAVDVEVFVWYEGQDSSCASSKALTTEGLDIAVYFTASDAPAV